MDEDLCTSTVTVQYIQLGIFSHSRYSCLGTIYSRFNTVKNGVAP
jgi:hypothetical protein